MPQNLIQELKGPWARHSTSAGSLFKSSTEDPPNSTLPRSAPANTNTANQRFVTACYDRLTISSGEERAEGGNRSFHPCFSIAFGTKTERERERQRERERKQESVRERWMGERGEGESWSPRERRERASRERKRERSHMSSRSPVLGLLGLTRAPQLTKGLCGLGLPWNVRGFTFHMQMCDPCDL